MFRVAEPKAMIVPKDIDPHMSTGAYSNSLNKKDIPKKIMILKLRYFHLILK